MEIKFVNDGFLTFETRCLFQPFEEESDINWDEKAGVRCHNQLTACILGLFDKIEEVQDAEGKTVYLNKNSLEKWKERQSKNGYLGLEKQPALPSIENIVTAQAKYIEGLGNLPASKPLRARLLNADFWSNDMRCVFLPFKAADDNRGIRCHNEVSAFFLNLFDKIKEVEDSKGRKIYLNKNSLRKWKERHCQQGLLGLSEAPPTIKQVVEAKRQYKAEVRKARDEGLDVLKCFDAVPTIQQIVEAQKEYQEEVERAKQAGLDINQCFDSLKTIQQVAQAHQTYLEEIEKARVESDNRSQRLATRWGATLLKQVPGVGDAVKIAESVGRVAGVASDVQGGNYSDAAITVATGAAIMGGAFLLGPIVPLAVSVASVSHLTYRTVSHINGPSIEEVALERTRARVGA